jgi:hypothetical protein
MGKIASSDLRSAQLGYRKSGTAANGRRFRDHKLRLLAGCANPQPISGKRRHPANRDPRRPIANDRFADA